MKDRGAGEGGLAVDFGVKCDLDARLSPCVVGKHSDYQFSVLTATLFARMLRPYKFNSINSCRGDWAKHEDLYVLVGYHKLSPSCFAPTNFIKYCDASIAAIFQQPLQLAQFLSVQP
jgi:hypothetical protein